MPVTYPDKLKVSAIHRYENGESIKVLSQKLHISQNTLYQWRKDYKKRQEYQRQNLLEQNFTAS